MMTKGRIFLFTLLHRRLSMKKWLIALAALIVLLAAGVMMLLFSLNSIVEKAVNTEGPNITGTSVHLDKADISLLAGKAALSGFTLGNPAGFSGDAVKLGSVAVELDTGTVFKDVIVIRKVAVDSPELFYVLGNNESNFDVILRNIQNYADSHESKDGAASGSQPADKEGSGKKVIIDELVIRNAKAALSVPKLGLSVTAPLPEIRLTDIGREKSGTSFASTALLVTKSVTRALADATVTQTKNLGSTLLKTGENAGTKAKSLLKDGLSLFK